MKNRAVWTIAGIVLLALIFLVVLFIGPSIAGPSFEYRCTGDSDCKIAYGVYNESGCYSGCYNKAIQRDARCNNTLFEQFSPETTCVCEKNRCKIIMVGP